MKACFLLGGSLLLASAAQAQVRFTAGPRVGLNVATTHFPDSSPGSFYTSRPGFEAGLTGNVQYGHFALQPSVLFSQKGYNLTSPLQYYDLPRTTGEVNQQIRLNYLTVPLNLTFALGKDGAGLQAFAGPYVSMLLGGSYKRQIHTSGYMGNPSSGYELSGKVRPASVVSDSDNECSRRFDTGLQAGLGYRLGRVQLQASYSLELRNLAAQYRAGGYTYNEPGYYNQAWQLSLS